MLPYVFVRVCVKVRENESEKESGGYSNEIQSLGIISISGEYGNGGF